MTAIIFITIFLAFTFSILYVERKQMKNKKHA